MVGMNTDIIPFVASSQAMAMFCIPVVTFNDACVNTNAFALKCLRKGESNSEYSRLKP